MTYILRRGRTSPPALQGAEQVPGLITGASDQKPKTLLYVGASIQRQNLLPELVAALWIIDIIEIFPANVEFLRAYPSKGIETIYEGDVRDAPFPRPSYDAAVWWHGPEHIPEDDVPGALARLEQVAHLVVLGGPLEDPPYAENSAPHGNPHERHCWSITVPFLKDLGYTVQCVQRPITTGFVAWKIMP